MNIDFEKADGLIPAIVQDAATKTVLMLGYMNREALEETRRTGKVTFYSRSRQTLWTKGETSGNYLELVDILTDCDQDALLIRARPAGPVCHTGQDTCFNEINRSQNSFLHHLQAIIDDRRANPVENSYTNMLFDAGIKKIVQKVGEESTEAIIEALTNDRKRLKEETADLLYHLLVLLRACDVTLEEVEEVLRERHIKK